jgi:hypothetical protein
MRRPRPDAGDRLARALHVGLSALGAQTAIEERTSRDWASITFSGARHCLRLRLEGYEACTAADALLANLGETRLDLCDHILVDLAVLRDERDESGRWVRLELEALTVEAS